MVRHNAAVAESLAQVENEVVLRIDTLRKFCTELQSAEVHDDGVFLRLFRRVQELLELSDQQIGDSLRVSRPTVNRWMNGRNLPHPLMRIPIAKWAVEQVIRRLKVLEKCAGR